MEVAHESPALAAHRPRVVAFAAAQNTNEALNEVHALNRRLRVQSEEDLKRYTPEARDAATKQLKQVIEKYVIDHLRSAPRDASGLRMALLDMQQIPFDPKRVRSTAQDYIATPYVLPESVGRFSGYIIAYLVMRGGWGSPDTTTFVQAYGRSGSSYRLFDQTGADFDHYGFFLKSLGTQHGELLLLPHGDVMGFNGTKIRARIYAFDGKHFRTLWAPPDRLDLVIRVSGNKLFLTYTDEHRYYEVRKPPYQRHDVVEVSAAGVTTESSKLGPQ